MRFVPLVALVACGSARVVPCDSAAALSGDAVPASAIGLYVDASGTGVDLLASDVARYLGALWNSPPPDIHRSAPDGSTAYAIWLSTSDAGKQQLGTSATDGYVLRRVDSGAQHLLIAWAPDAQNLAYAGYALLEQLGIRFFHPKEELVPKLAGPRFPTTLDVTRVPAVKMRGLHLHTLHPIEYLKVLDEPGDDNYADAVKLIDWLVKTGQNYFQWPLLRTVDFAAWSPHAKRILDYAHSRGVKVGWQAELWGGAALQNNVILMNDTSQPPSAMDALIDQYFALPWDALELDLGEFSGADPSVVLALLNHAVDYTTTKHPGTTVAARNHVGNYKNLYLQYMGQTLFFYHLPKYADLRLGSHVHTLSIFDLYRDWATYAHPDFHLQHDLILEELPTGRDVWYYPESAYWLAADDDIPAFLPEFIYARWLDINMLTAEIAQKGLPALGGHLTFSSGHEWGYWLTDYLVAHQLWQPGISFDDLLGQFTSGFGSCAGDVHSELASFTSLQTTYLFDQRLFAYLQGEDEEEDLGYLVGLETHPKRLAFETVMGMAPAAQDAFVSTVIAPLEAMAEAIAPLESEVAARCRGSDAPLKPFCDELDDGMEIVRLRALHSAALYRATLSGGQRSFLGKAQSIAGDAQKVVTRRESGYRFDLSRLTDAYPSPTVYPFGYLRQAHTLCYWSRQQLEVQTLLDSGAPAAIGDLPSCQN